MHNENGAVNVNELIEERDRLRKRVSDLQSGMCINCVYCGHRYGPKRNTPVSMADVLKEHVEKCPEHPMSKIKKELERSKITINSLTEDCSKFRDASHIDQLKRVKTQLATDISLLSDWIKEDDIMKGKVCEKIDEAITLLSK